MTDHSQRLRALGQALELLKLDEFAIEPDQAGFLVRANSHARAANAAESPLADSGHDTVDGDGRALSPAKKHVPMTGIELRYTRADIERFEKAGRARRSDAQGMPDCDSSSHFLRVAGAYIARKAADLVQISYRQQSLIVSYRLPSGQRCREAFIAADLFDLWLELYGSRASALRHRPISPVRTL